MRSPVRVPVGYAPDYPDLVARWISRRCPGAGAARPLDARGASH